MTLAEFPGQTDNQNVSLESLKPLLAKVLSGA